MKIPQSHSINSFKDLIGNHLPDMFLAIVRVLAILIVFLILRRLISKIIKRFFDVGLSRIKEESEESRKSRVMALKTVVTSVSGFVLAFTCVIMILQSVGVNIVPVITTAGVAGLAIGIGAQKLVKDLIAGFFLLVEDQYGVGEIVTIDSITGEVVELGMRITKIRDGSNKLCIFSNGDIIRVINHSRGSIVTTLDISIQPFADSETAQNILTDICGKVTNQYSSVASGFKVVGIIKHDGLNTTFRISGNVAAKSETEIRNSIYQMLKEDFAKNAIMLV